MRSNMISGKLPKLSKKELEERWKKEKYAITEILNTLGPPTPPIGVQFFGKFDRRKSDLSEKLKDMHPNLELYLPYPAPSTGVELDTMSPEKLLEIILKDYEHSCYGYNSREPRFSVYPSVEFFTLEWRQPKPGEPYNWKTPKVKISFDLGQLSLTMEYKNCPMPQKVKNLMKRLNGTGVSINVHTYNFYDNK
ncbi:MAG: hypothetical protein V1839_03595 [archaeon]